MYHVCHSVESAEVCRWRLSERCVGSDISIVQAAVVMRRTDEADNCGAI
jgi:hypothetical protein